MEKESKIYVAGHGGMVGSAILRRLEKDGYRNFILRNSAELDLKNQQAVELFFEQEKPEYVFLVAAKVGGIYANNIYRADFIYENIMIQSNVIHASYKYAVKKLLFTGSSCIYPKIAPQPLKEEYLLTGPLEVTNEPYAIAKIAGIKMCDAYRDQYGCNFISCMPTNLYGPNDNYDLLTSHVLPALIRKIYEAKLKEEKAVQIWGTGKVRREFLHVDDMADASCFLMNQYNNAGMVNIGCGEDLTIAELAMLIKKVIGYKGEFRFETTKPDGTPRKLMDVSLLNQLGWKPQIALEDGIHSTFLEFKNKYQEIVSRS